MHLFLTHAAVLLVGLVLGVLFGTKIEEAVEEGFKALSQTLHERLVAIETAVKGTFSHSAIHVESVAGAALKSEDEYVDGIVEKVLAKMKEAQKLVPLVLLMLTISMAACWEPVYAQGTVRPALPIAAPLPVGTYYSPEQNLEALDVAALGAARAEVEMAAFSMTDQAIADTLKDRAQHGAHIQLYLDRGELQAECRGDITCARIPLHELIGLAGIEIRVKFSKVLMHLKSYEVDHVLVRDGSANFSVQGETRQDNSAIFSGDPGSVAGFAEKFKAMWNRPDNLTVAQAVAEPPK